MKFYETMRWNKTDTIIAAILVSTVAAIILMARKGF